MILLYCKKNINDMVCKSSDNMIKIEDLEISNKNKEILNQYQKYLITIKFLNVDLYKSEATVWTVGSDYEIYPPFNAIDGLGDTFDAIYSNRDKERMLEIMKDSRLGTNSLLAILFLVLIKIGLLNSLISANLMCLIVFMPMISRLAVIVMLYKTVTPRKVGMGNIFIGKATLGMFITATVYTSVILVLISKLIFLSTNINLIKLLSSILAVMLFNQLFKKSVYKKIDGVTGDILGCSIELGELVFLLYTYIIILI